MLCKILKKATSDLKHSVTKRQMKMKKTRMLVQLKKKAQMKLQANLRSQTGCRKFARSNWIAIHA